MALTDEEEATASGRGRALDRMGHLRNKLVTVVQEHPDEEVRAKARQRLSELPTMDVQGPERGARSSDQSDPNPSGPLYGGFDGKGEENPGFLRKMDTSLGMMVANPAKRRQAIAEYDKGLTGGIVTKVGQKIGGWVGDDSMSPESLERYAKEEPLSPWEKGGLRIAGAVTPGSMSRVMGGAAEKGLMKAPGALSALKAAPTVTGAAVGAGSAALASGGTEGVTALVEGQGLGEAAARAKAAATDPLTIGLGAFMGGAAARAKAAREGNRDVRLIEDRGGRVGPTTPGSGAPFDDPLVAQGIDDAGRVTESGRGKVAIASGKGAAGAIQSREAAASGRYHQAKDAAQASGALSAPADVTSLYDDAVRMANDPSLPREVRNKIKGEIVEDMFGAFGGVADDGAGGMRVTMTAENANATKQKLQYLADFSAVGKPEPNFGRLATQAKGAVDKTAYGKINEGFSSESGHIEDARRALGMKPEFGAPVTPAQEKGLAALFMRRGQDTGSAGKDITPELAEALERYPELRKFLEAPELLQARGRMEFGLGGESVGGFRDWARSTVGRNIDPAKARLLEPAASGALRMTPAAGPFFNRIRDAAAEEDRRRRRP